LLRRGEQRETVLELAASLRGHEVSEVLRHAVAWPLSVPRGLSRLAHRGEEGEGVFGVHRCGSFHEVLEQLADEEVLLWVLADPCAMARDMCAESTEQLGVGDHDRPLPAVALEVRLMALTQEHDGGGTIIRRAERKVSVEFGAVPIGGA